MYSRWRYAPMKLFTIRQEEEKQQAGKQTFVRGDLGLVFSLISILTDVFMIYNNS